jgi:DNA-binding PadR family transcriptional regulator
MLAGGPLHPYAIQRLMKAWGKHKVVNVGQRANLYKTIERLRADGLVSVSKVERDQRFPERTIYELTEAGRRAGQEWLAQMLANPRYEFPEFPAALSFIFELDPAEAKAALEKRLTALKAQLAEHERELADEGGPPRLFLLETDYLRKVTSAEVDWVTDLLLELDSGELSWTKEQLARIASHFMPADSV